ncbi:MAG: leucine-rich repeat protein [Bacteroidaceae bacterium]|nr:leucine-rich repeat protein [Bacteroidaceae bacterium]
MKRKLQSLLLVLMALLCSNSLFAHDFEVDGIYYNITSSTDMTVSVTFKGNSESEFSNEYSGAVTIPKSVTHNNNTYCVTSIGNQAFFWCSGLTSISIPNSVTSIEGRAFYWCQNLSSISIPNSVTSIGEYAFYDCYKLTALTIPSSVTSIGKGAFSSCRNLTSIAVATGNPKYDSRENCNAIIETETNTLISGCNSSVIPNNVKRIEESAFSGCYGLTSITIPNSVTSIGASAFSGCDGLTSITIPNSVTNIGSSAFSYCSKLTSIIIPNSVTSIGSYAFSNCSGLTSITIGNNVKIIDRDAFSQCSNLTSVTLNCKNVANWFANTSSLKKVVLGDNVNNIGENAFSSCSGLTSVTIGNGVKNIGNRAFYNCENLTSITIPNSVTNIGEYAFQYCSGLSSVTIGNSVKSIGESAFYNCENLTSITIPNSVTSIGESAFGSCSGLTSIIIPSNVTSIGENAFSWCNGLTSIVVAAGNSKYDSRENCNALIETETKTLLKGTNKSKIPNGVTSIGDYAFYDCDGLTSITIPSSVTSIGSSAFEECYIRTVINHSNLNITKNSKDHGAVAYFANKVLSGEPVNGFYFEETDGKYILTGYEGNATDLTLPTSYKGKGYNIGDYAFYDCDGLTSITIPNGVTYIGDNAFYDCDDLTSINIPNSVTSIGDNAFSDCDGLTSINIPNSVTFIGDDAFYGTAWYNNQSDGVIYAGRVLYDYKGVMPNYTYITVKDGTVSISPYAFSSRSNMASITIPNSVTRIGDDAFNGCSGLTSITIPNSVTSIGSWAFSSCSGLKTITIPNSVTSIGYNAFYATAWYNNQPDGVVYAGRVLYKYKGTMPDNTSIEVKEGTVTISSNAFYNCSGLTSISIPSSVTSIEEDALSSCSGLSSIVVAEGNSKYDSRGNCNAIIERESNTLIAGCQKSTIPNTVTRIGNEAFYNCDGLTSISIPNSVTHIGSWAFYDCNNLTSVDLGNGVTNIEERAFYYCSAVKAITIPGSIKSIGTEAFYNCSALKTVVNCSDLDFRRNSDHGYVAYYADRVLSDKEVGIVGDYYFMEKAGKNYLICYAGNETNLTLPETYKGQDYSIADKAFYQCSKLTSVTIPNSVDSIGNSAFYYCSNLYSVTIPYSVVSIGNRAFYGCSKLTYVNIPNSVTNIGTSAFNGCSNLASITIPNSVTSVGEYAFNNTAWYNNQPDGVIYTGRVLYDYKGAMPKNTSIDVREGTVSIGYSAFSGYNNLTSITIPNSVTYIGDDAFNYCSKMTLTTMPKGITNVGRYAFNYCDSLKTFDFNGVQKIGESAFRESGLESIHLPASVQEIGNGAFSSLYKLKTLTIAKDFNPITYDLTGVFQSPSALEHIIVEDGNEKFDSRDNCNALIYTDGEDAVLLLGSKNAFIPHGVTKVGPTVFADIPMADIVIPSSVKEILPYAFAATNPQSIICQATVPPILVGLEFGYNPFFNINTSIPVYVPNASLSDYRNDDGWGMFANIFPIDDNIRIEEPCEVFENSNHLYNVNVTYTRTLPNLKWNALYLPVEIPVSELTDNYDVAYYNDMHAYDRNNDGTIDQLDMEVIRILSGTLHANHPYFIRAKNEAAKKMHLELSDVTLHSTDAEYCTSLSSSSVYMNFEITGVYTRHYAKDLEGCYAITSSGSWAPIAAGSYLNPFRFYLKMTNRNGTPVKADKALQSIRIYLQGEEETTGIEGTTINGQESTEIYDLQGRRVVNPAKGMYIIDGKKVMIK